MKLTINFADFEQINLGNVNNKVILSLVKKDKKSYYLVIPTCLTYSLFSDSIELSCNSSLEAARSIFNSFQNTFNNIKNDKQVLLKKKILLKGLGFRSVFDSTAKTVSFKLGYSHLNTMDVPDYIKQIKIKKNHILVESSDKILLGDYVKKIHQLRESDIYKGKGFSYPYDTKKLKIIKKK
jgi:ribosomal protein L6P/L9E